MMYKCTGICVAHLFLSPGLCGCTASTQDRPCPQRRLYTSLGAGQPLGAASGPPWGTSAGSHWKGTQSRYKWAFVWCTRRTAGPGSHGEASWFERNGEGSHVLVFLTEAVELHFPVWRMSIISLMHKTIVTSWMADKRATSQSKFRLI